MKREDMTELGRDEFGAVFANVDEERNLTIVGQDEDGKQSSVCLSTEMVDRLRSLLATPAAPQGQVDVLVGALERMWCVAECPHGVEPGADHYKACPRGMALAALAAYRAGVPQGERRGDAGSLPSSQIPQEQSKLQTCGKCGTVGGGGCIHCDPHDIDGVGR